MYYFPGEPNAPQNLSAFQVECTSENSTSIVCQVVSFWSYSPNNSTQAGVTQFLLFINGTVDDYSKTTILRTFHDGSCGTNMVAVSAVNICGLRSKRNASVAARSVQRDAIPGILRYDLCGSGAANKDRKLYLISFV